MNPPKVRITEVGNIPWRNNLMNVRGAHHVIRSSIYRHSKIHSCFNPFKDNTIPHKAMPPRGFGHMKVHCVPSCL